MRLLWGMLWRTLFFGSLWVLLCVVALISLANGGFAQPSPFLIRLAFFAPAALLILLESTLMEANVDRLKAAFPVEDAPEPTGPTWRRRLSSWRPPYPLLGLSMLWLLLDSRFVDHVSARSGMGTGLVTASIGGFILSVVLWRLFWLVRWTWRDRSLRFRIMRARELERPGTWTAFPLVSLVLAMTGLLPALLMRTPVGVDWGARTLQGFLPDMRSDEDLELFVRTRTDSWPLSMSWQLWRHGAERHDLEPAGTESESQLSRTHVVRVPRLRADDLTEAFADHEAVQRVELAASMTMPELLTGDACLVDTTAADPFIHTHGDHTIQSLRAAIASRTRSAISPALLAIVADGIDTDHPDVGHLLQTSVTKTHGRFGTALAVLGAAHEGNGLGIGSPNIDGRLIQLLDLPVFQEEQARASDIARAILEATEQGSDVLLLPFAQLGQAPTPLVDAVQRALAEDVLVITTAGRGGRATVANSTHWPANIPGVLVVGTLDDLGRPWVHSNHADASRHSVWMPGASLCVPEGEDYRLTTSETAAAARAAGAMAALRAICPDVEARNWLEHLRQVQADTAPLSPDAVLAQARRSGGCGTEVLSAR